MFKIIKGGCNARHPSTFKLSRPDGLPNYVFLNIKTPALFIINGKTHNIQANTGIIIPPDTPYTYQTINMNYVDDWLHFRLNDDNYSLSKYVTPGSFFRVYDVDILTEYIKMILWESTYNTSNSSDTVVDQLMGILLNHLCEDYKNRKKDYHYSPYNTKLQNIRITMRSSLYNPITADECAKILGISKDRFFHIYTETFGVSFKKDYIQMRIQHAQNLLETTDTPIEHIAQITGYASDVHFYRQFQKYVGQTPSHYRKLFHSKGF